MSVGSKNAGNVAQCAGNIARRRFSASRENLGSKELDFGYIPLREKIEKQETVIIN